MQLLGHAKDVGSGAIGLSFLAMTFLTLWDANGKEDDPSKSLLAGESS